MKIFPKPALENELSRTGFIDLLPLDVGAKPIVAFIVAAKPR
ncbi:hypothetical protein WME75_13700 [Sorangium sp. So ce1014]